MSFARHGGALDAAMALHGGQPQDWIDLSTGINPDAFPVPDMPISVWTRLPDSHAFARLEQAARTCWAVPDDLQVVAAPGTSSLIAAIPALAPPGRVEILSPTYSEHALAFRGNGRQVDEVREFSGAGAVSVAVSPNNPTGSLLDPAQIPRSGLSVIDESFADSTECVSVLNGPLPASVIVLKGLGKFWGLAGLRLGFAICTPAHARRLQTRLGPWAVSGPALEIGTRALQDRAWADATRSALSVSAARLDRLLAATGIRVIGGTTLFRLAAHDAAAGLFSHLIENRILVRKFDYNDTWLRFGIPGAEEDWLRLDKVLKGF